MNNNYFFINISSHSLIYSIEKDIKNLINQITEKQQLETLYYILEGLQLLSKTIPNENFEEMERKKERIEKYNKVYYDIELLDNYLAKQENDDNQNTKKILSLEECLKELNNQYNNLIIKFGEVVEKNKEIESNIDKKEIKVKKYNKNLDEEKKKNNELKKKVVDAENRFKLSIQELKNSQSNSTFLKKKYEENKK